MASAESKTRAEIRGNALVVYDDTSKGDASATSTSITLAQPNRAAMVIILCLYILAMAVISIPDEVDRETRRLGMSGNATARLCREGRG